MYTERIYGCSPLHRQYTQNETTANCMHGVHIRRTHTLAHIIIPMLADSRQVVRWWDQHSNSIKMDNKKFKNSLTIWMRPFHAHHFYSFVAQTPTTSFAIFFFPFSHVWEAEDTIKAAHNYYRMKNRFCKQSIFDFATLASNGIPSSTCYHCLLFSSEDIYLISIAKPQASILLNYIFIRENEKKNRNIFVCVEHLLFNMQASEKASNPDSML